MLPSEPLRHHRIKKIVIGIIVVPIALFLMLLIVGLVASVFERSKQIESGNYNIIKQAETNAPTDSYTEAERRLIEGIGTQSFGASAPKLTIVEFADFACPYCRSSFPGLRELSVKYQDSVKLIFRDWPGHKYSIQLAQSAYCAGEQGKFWEMHDKLYFNQSETFGEDKNDLARLASELNVYNEQFQSCFDSQKYLTLIQKNTLDSQTLGVAGTPTWFFNGTKIEGALTKTELEELIKVYVE